MKSFLVKILTFSLVVSIFVCVGTACKKHVCEFTKTVIEPTCTMQGYTLNKCSCGEENKDTFVNALGHDFKNYVSDGNATESADGTKTAICEREGCNATDTIVDVGSILQGAFSFNSDFSVTGTNVYATVSSDTSSIYLPDVISLTGNASFKAYYDVGLFNEITSNTIGLSMGDWRHCYIKAKAGVTETTYYLSIYRRTKYTVKFVTNNGTTISDRYLEEDSIIEKPNDLEKAGYNFNGWDYDFNVPLKNNQTITAIWSAKTNTPYKVEYYLENAENDDYTKTETVEKTGITDNTVFAEIKTFNEFIPKSQTVSGVINGDGSTVIKVYYTRKKYQITSQTYGTVNEEGMHKYGETLTLTATANVGYQFIGWYNDIGEELETENDYTVTVDKNIVAKYQAKQYFVNFDANGGSGYYPNKVVTYDSYHSLPEVDKSEFKNGYLFYGWTYNNVVVHSWDAWKIDSDSVITLKAKWVENYYTLSGNYIYFGRYPQTIKADNVTVSDTINFNGYYLGSDGEEYAKVVIGENYPILSNGERLEQGETYYFKVEPIRWRILIEDNGVATLVCDSIIDVKRYDDNSNNYEESEIRSWLNNEFYNTAFNVYDKNIINVTDVINNANSTGEKDNQYACGNTNDRIYLPSYVEACILIGSMFDDENRIMHASDYSVAIGVNCSFGNGRWWLRSPNHTNPGMVRIVEYNGVIDKPGTSNQDESKYVYYTNIGAVPMLKIKL